MRKNQLIVHVWFSHKPFYVFWDGMATQETRLISPLAATCDNLELLGQHVGTLRGVGLLCWQTWVWAALNKRFPFQQINYRFDLNYRFDSNLTSPDPIVVIYHFNFNQDPPIQVV
jgi:hypothetical protein